MRTRFQVGATIIGPLLVAFALTPGLSDPLTQMQPWLGWAGALLILLAIVLAVEGKSPGSIVQRIKADVSGSPTNLGGTQVNQPGWFHLFNRTTTTVIHSPTDTKGPERRSGPPGRRLLDQPAPDPNKRIAYVGAKDDDIKLFSTSTGEYLFTIIQVWFRSEDKVVPISELSAEILETDDHNDYWNQHHGRWTIGTEPGNVGGWTQTKIKTGLGPGELAKLNAFVRGPHWKPGICRFFVEDDNFNDSRNVEGTDRAVRITLHASGGIDRTFSFRLVNDGTAFALLIR